MSMRAIVFTTVLCFTFFSVKCFQDFCYNGLSAAEYLESNSRVEYKAAINNIAEDYNFFKANMDENVKVIRELIATKNLSDDQPMEYVLLTNRNPTEPYFLTFDRQNLKASPYNDKNPTVIIIHNFKPDPYFYNDGIISQVKIALLDTGDYNIIYPDYSKVLSESCYDSIKNGYLVAKNVSSFIYFLKENSATDLKDIQLMGHSIGGQISGIIGKFTPGIGRISAFDPSDPIYRKMPDDLRLGPNDADLVDVIHTNGRHFPLGYAVHKKTGTLDFYVNGGKEQPNCLSLVPPTEDLVSGFQAGETFCMHDRAIDYFVTSMCKSCQYIGVACKSYKDFKRGKCNKNNSRTAIMGQYATKPKEPLPDNLKFFIDTDDARPYCRNTTEPRQFK